MSDCFDLFLPSKSRALLKNKYSTLGNASRTVKLWSLHKTRVEIMVTKIFMSHKIRRSNYRNRARSHDRRSEWWREWKISKASFIRMLQNLVSRVYSLFIPLPSEEVRVPGSSYGQHTVYQNWLKGFSIMTLSNKFQISLFISNGVIRIHNDIYAFLLRSFVVTLAFLSQWRIHATSE
jgi:hypothetical protein